MTRRAALGSAALGSRLGTAALGSPLGSAGLGSARLVAVLVAAALPAIPACGGAAPPGRVLAPGEPIPHPAVGFRRRAVAARGVLGYAVAFAGDALVTVELATSFELVVRPSGRDRAADRVALGPAERDVTALAVDAGAGRAWVASTAGTVRALDLASGLESGQPSGQPGRPASGQPSGRVVTTWHLGAPATAVAASAGYVATGTADGVLCLRRASGALLQCTVAHQGQISGLAFDPGGAALASTGWDGDAAVWTVPALAVIARRRFRAPGGAALCINDVAFAPDGRALALAHSAAPPRRSPAVAAAERRRDAYTRPDPAAVITLWTPGETRARALRGHGGPVTAVAWTDDGARLMSGSWDRTVRMWDVNTGVEIARSGRFAHIVRDVAVRAGRVAAVAWTSGRDGPAAVTFDLLY